MMKYFAVNQISCIFVYQIRQIKNKNKKHYENKNQIKGQNHNEVRAFANSLTLIENNPSGYDKYSKSWWLYQL